MIETKEKCWKKTSETKKGLNKNKKWRFFLGWVFFGGFSWREKRILKVISNTVENKTDFFAQKCSWTKRTETENKREFFPHFTTKNTFLFLHTSERRKKRNRVEKMKQKNRRVIKTRNHFSRHRKRPNMEK